MLQQLQDYLFQFRSAAVPEVGFFHLESAPASFDVVHQLMVPPVYAIRFVPGDGALTTHQLQTFSAAYDNDLERAELELAQFGAAFQDSLNQQEFSWPGLGTMALQDNHLRFAPLQQPGFLEPVAARKVIREDASHSVLVGDQELQRSAAMYEPAEAELSARRSWSVVAGWVLALLALAFIIYLLYQQQWRPEASGLRQQPVVSEAPAQHR